MFGNDDWNNDSEPKHERFKKTLDSYGRVAWASSSKAGTGALYPGYLANTDINYIERRIYIK